MHSKETANTNKQAKCQIEVNLKEINSHKTAALHFASASKYHLNAAGYHSEGDFKKALENTILAHGHAGLAREAQRDYFNNFKSKF